MAIFGRIAQAVPVGAVPLLKHVMEMIGAHNHWLGPAVIPHQFARLFFSSLDTMFVNVDFEGRSEEHTSELQSLMRISYAVFCLKKTNKKSTILPNSIDHQNILDI